MHQAIGKDGVEIAPQGLVEGVFMRIAYDDILRRRRAGEAAFGERRIEAERFKFNVGGYERARQLCTACPGIYLQR